MTNLTLSDYSRMLERLDLKKVRLMRHTYDKTKDIINIRHDVDDDIEAAIKMAQIERDKGIVATYFILDTAPYFCIDSKITSAIRRIADMGHEIGWHNNIITRMLQYGTQQAIAETDIILKYLRKISPVTGTASHGDPLCYRHGYINYYYFGLHRADNLQKFPVFDTWSMATLQDHGFDYEAYFTGHTHYISESGGVWRQNNDEVFSDFEKNGGKLQILIHPQWWKK